MNAMPKRWLARCRRLLWPQSLWWGPLLCLLAVVCGLGLGFWLRHLRAADVREHRARLKQLQPEQAEALLRQMQRWERMSPEDRQRVQRLHQQVESHPQKEQLLEAMQRFHRWLIQVPLEIQFEMLNSDASTPERLEQFRKLYLQWLGSRWLSPSEQEGLIAWWRNQLLAKRLLDPEKFRQGFPRLRPPGQQPLRPGPPPAERRLWELLRRGLISRNRERLFHRLRNFLKELDDEAYQELVRSWPQETAGQWHFVRSREEKQALVLRWTTGILMRRFFARYHRKSDQLHSLARRFQQLSFSAKARLLELSPERFFAELQALEEPQPPSIPRPRIPPVVHPPVVPR